MNIVNAEDVLVKVAIDGDYYDVGCATNVSVLFENELIGKTDVNAGLFRKRRVRISDFLASIQGLVTLDNLGPTVSSFYFLQEAVRRTELTLQFIFTDVTGQIRIISGLFLIQSMNNSGGASGDMAEYDLELQGTGDFGITDVESPADLICYETKSDWWTPSAASTSFSGTGFAGRSFLGQTVVEVVRESGPPLVFTSGTPGEREYSFNGTSIGVWASNPFDGVERVFVIWQDII